MVKNSDYGELNGKGKEIYGNKTNKQKRSKKMNENKKKIEIRQN